MNEKRNILRELVPISDDDFFIVLNHMNAKFDFPLHFHEESLLKKLEEKRKAGIIVVGGGGSKADSEFKEELRSLGGVPEEILEDEDLYNYFSPIMRADFEILEKNKL